MRRRFPCDGTVCTPCVHTRARVTSRDETCCVIISLHDESDGRSPTSCRAHFVTPNAPDLHVQPDAAVAGSCRLCVASETSAVLRVFAACARCSRRSFVPHSAVRASETFAWLVSMQRVRRVAEIFYDALYADGYEIENE